MDTEDENWKFKNESVFFIYLDNGEFLKNYRSNFQQILFKESGIAISKNLLDKIFEPVEEDLKNDLKKCREIFYK